MIIRQLTEADYQDYTRLESRLSEETIYHKNEPVRAHANSLSKLRDPSRSIILVAEQDNQLIGRISLWCDAGLFARYTARLEIGVREAFQGQGVGKALIQMAIEWAVEHKIKRLELTVAEKNRKALWLFGRTGFTVEGTRRQSVKYDDRFEDEFYMALLLS